VRVERGGDINICDELNVIETGMSERKMIEGPMYAGESLVVN